MIKSLFFLLLGAAVAPAGAARGTSSPTSPLGTGSGVMCPRPSSRAWCSAVVLGRAGETPGVTKSQTRFASNDLIELRVDISGTAPGIEVRATWFDGQGHVLGSEAHRSRIGEHVMVFPSPSPRGLEPGPYRVQLRIGGQLIRDQPFQVEAMQDKPGSSVR